MTASTRRLVSTVLASLTLGMSALYAQPDAVDVTESGNTPIHTPRDNFYHRYLHTEERPIAYDFIHEKDVFWEKRIWRVIDTKEKRNHVFRYEKAPFIHLLLQSALEGDLTLYHMIDDEFTQPLSVSDVKSIMYRSDTVATIDPETFEETIVVVQNELNWEDITRYRIKEVYFFDEETSSLDVRILGLAPIIERLDDNGNFLNSGPLFWLYYPAARGVLARHEVYNAMNDAARMSWEDLFEARLFDGYVYKESNVQDRRIKDYVSDPLSILLESKKIEASIFNFEHDLWSY